MIGVLMILGSRGDILLSRAFRDNMNVRLLADTFRLDLIATRRAERSPIHVINRTAYVHIKFDTLYCVACTPEDADSALILQFMVRMWQILHTYLEDGVTEESLRENFATVQQLIDEALDYGFPQLTELDVLKALVSTGSSSDDSALTRKADAQKITVKATGAIPWRRDGIFYRDNEVFVDVNEQVNLLLSQTGTVLQCEVVGRVIVKSFLSGYPQCSIVLNDKQLIDSGAAGQGGAPTAGGAPGAAGTAEDGEVARVRKEVALDDCSFHQCVKLSAFEGDRSIHFIPPDGEFVLMRYRSTDAIAPPFRVVSARSNDISRTRYEVAFRLKSTLPAQHSASQVVVSIPCPSNTAAVNVRVQQGRAKYDVAKQAIIWKIPAVHGSNELPFSAEVQLLPTTMQTERVWSRPPITVAFNIGTVSVSGLRVQSLRVEEPKLQYNATKWVRYLSAAGQYQIRL